jgi:hypothetical protein
MRLLALMLLIGCVDSETPPEHEYALCADICDGFVVCSVPRGGTEESCSCAVEGKLTPVICKI